MPPPDVDDDDDDQNAWREAQTPDGRTFYFHRVSREVCV